MPTLPFEAFQYQKLFLQSGQFSVTIKDSGSVKEYSMPNAMTAGSVDWSYTSSTAGDNWNNSSFSTDTYPTPTMDPQSMVNFNLIGRVNALEAELDIMKKNMKKLLDRMPLEDQERPGRKLDLA